MKSSTQDQAEGKIHKVKGEIKEIAGKLSKNPDLETEGKEEKITGEVKKRSDRSRRFLGSRRRRIMRLPTLEARSLKHFFHIFSVYRSFQKFSSKMSFGKNKNKKFKDI